MSASRPDDTYNPARHSQFLHDSAAFLDRLANLAAQPYWEEVEIRFAILFPSDRDGLVLIARLRNGNRWLGERFFTMEELREVALLPQLVETWVQALDVLE